MAGVRTDSAPRVHGRPLPADALCKTCSGDDADSGRREAELADRVDAIHQQTWRMWLEGPQRTMASLRGLETQLEDGSVSGTAHKAA